MPRAAQGFDAGGPGRAGARDVDLVGVVQCVGRVPGQHVAEPGHEPAPGHENRSGAASVAVEREERAQVVVGVGHDRRVDSVPHRPPGPFQRGDGGHRDGDRIGPRGHAAVADRGPGNRLDRAAERGRDVVGPRPVATGHEQPVEARRVEQLAGGADGHLAGAHQEHRGHRSSGPSSSRHPPVVEGTLPLARSRTTMPAVIAIAATSSPRRNAFTVGPSLPRHRSAKSVDLRALHELST